jgi:tetratricopeptide (TPR) repeat protein
MSPRQQKSTLTRTLLVVVFGGLGLVVLVGLAGALVLRWHRPDANAHFAKGNTLFAESNWSQAIFEYRVALQADPLRGDIRAKLADAYMHANDLGNAYQQYIRAADLLPNDVTAQLRAGDMLLLARKFDDAKTRANKALALDPKSAEAQILLGNAAAGLRDLDGAITEYQDAVTLDPNSDRAYQNMGAVQATRGHLDEAEASFRKAVAVAPKALGPRLALANLFWATHRQAEAEQALKGALQLDPLNLTANRALGTFYLASNRVPEAEPYFKAIAQTAKTPAAITGLADYYIAAKRPDDARNVLVDLAARDDGFAMATTRLAALDASQGQRAQALARLRKVLDKYPKDDQAGLLEARLLYADGKRDDAIAAANVVAANSPQARAVSAAYLLIGSIEASRDRQDEAVKAFEEVLKRDPRPLAADLALATLYLDDRSFDKTTTYVQQALDLDPRNPQARGLSVRLDVAKGDLPKARTEAEALQKDFPGSTGVLSLNALLAMADRRFDDARKLYIQTAARNPNDMEPLAGLVQIDLASGHPKDATARIEAAEKVSTPSVALLVLASRAYAATGDFDKAEASLKQAIDVDPARIEAYGMLGGLYVARHRLEDARDRFQQVVDRDPKSVPANTMLGMILEAEGRLPEAQQQYLKVLAVDPRAAVAANNLAWQYVAANQNLDKALELAQTAKQQLPNEPHVNDTLGWIYYRRHLPAQAVTYLEASVTEDPNDPASNYHLGMAYVADGDLDKAKKSLTKALSFKGGFDGSAEARKALDQIGG